MTNILLIMGASSDMGVELIKSIDEECVIVAHYHSSNAKLLALVGKIKPKLVLFQADLSSETAVSLFIDKVESEYGIPNKIVHFAAPKFDNIRFKDVVWDDFQNTIDISLKSIVMILNRFLPKLAKEKRGKVVVMLSSTVLNVPPKALAHYTTVKYALLGLVKSLASEYAGKNIQINAVSPSMVDTQFLDNINEKIVELSAYSHPLKRNAVVGDVIPSIGFLLSDDSNYINGVNIPIAGGSIF